MLHQIDPEPHGPMGDEMAKAVSTCVHCGFCLPACPTYHVLGQETESPRGRIVLMKEALEANLDVDQALPHLDHCLGCLACEPACPSGVEYGKLISGFRSLSEPNRTRGFWESLPRRLAKWTLPYPGRFRWAARMGRLAKPLTAVLPGSLRTMLRLLPARLPRPVRWKEFYGVEGTAKGRVALLVGCAAQVLDPDINLATIAVLNHNGFEVVVPRSQTCCGGLHWHTGDGRAARSLARNNLKAFEIEVDAVITNAAGCGSTMKEYGMMFRGSDRQDDAESLANRVLDIATFLDSLGDQLRPFPTSESDGSPRQRRIAYQDACHLTHAQRAGDPPRRLLMRIPGVKLVPVPDAHLCCGSAGTYNIDQPEIADQLGREKVAALLSTDCQEISSGNIGCLTQIKMHLKAEGKSQIPVRHTIQILRDAYER